MTLTSPRVLDSPRRQVYNADALAWLREQGRLVDASVVTSLPDLSELPTLGLAAYRVWLEEAAFLTMKATPESGAAIFFQSDIRVQGEWVDKGAVVSKAAERAGMVAAFHKIVCRLPPGTPTFGKASYSHLLGFVWPTHLRKPSRASPDVIPDGGFKPAVKSMGVNACVAACKFIQVETSTRIVVDPFCGYGTVLAVANAMGMDSVGVDLSTRMCRRARSLAIDLSKPQTDPPRQSEEPSE